MNEDDSQGSPSHEQIADIRRRIQEALQASQEVNEEIAETPEVPELEVAAEAEVPLEDVELLGSDPEELVPHAAAEESGALEDLDEVEELEEPGHLEELEELEPVADLEVVEEEEWAPIAHEVNEEIAETPEMPELEVAAEAEVPLEDVELLGSDPEELVPLAAAEESGALEDLGEVEELEEPGHLEELEELEPVADLEVVEEEEWAPIDPKSVRAMLDVGQEEKSVGDGWEALEEDEEAASETEDAGEEVADFEEMEPLDEDLMVLEDDLDMEELAEELPAAKPVDVDPDPVWETLEELEEEDQPVEDDPVSAAELAEDAELLGSLLGDEALEQLIEEPEDAFSLEEELVLEPEEELVLEPEEELVLEPEEDPITEPTLEDASDPVEGVSVPEQEPATAPEPAAAAVAAPVQPAGEQKYCILCHSLIAASARVCPVCSKRVVLYEGQAHKENWRLLIGFGLVVLGTLLPWGENPGTHTLTGAALLVLGLVGMWKMWVALLGNRLSLGMLMVGSALGPIGAATMLGPVTEYRWIDTDALTKALPEGSPLVMDGTVRGDNPLLLEAAASMHEELMAANDLGTLTEAQAPLLKALGEETGFSALASMAAEDGWGTALADLLDRAGIGRFVMTCGGFLVLVTFVGTATGMGKGKGKGKPKKRKARSTSRKESGGGGRKRGKRSGRKG